MTSFNVLPRIGESGTDASGTLLQPTNSASSQTVGRKGILLAENKKPLGVGNVSSNNPAVYKIRHDTLDLIRINGDIQPFERLDDRADWDIRLTYDRIHLLYETPIAYCLASLQ
jgi:hypothetical protein